MPSLFWSSFATGSNSETAAFLATHLKRVLGEVQQQTGAVVAGVLTDNASNLGVAWQLLVEKLPVIGGGCSAHVLNLLIQDMFKLNVFKTSQAKALAITTFVRDHHAPLSQFQTMLKETCNDHRRTLSASAAMRWYSLHACLSRVPKNKGLLKNPFLERGHTELLARSASTRTTVVKLQQVQIDLRDRSFWWELGQVVVFLDPVIEALRELESDTCPTSHVYSRFR
ncbi:hypothetical protein PHMEG_00031662 [Phytophthora megakarya]|uniref:Uncharacterized protein n=1 Tax=Phytophthora megakarya TaxID=4795 RepID=A0A225UY41_9STRA|nr:hypothetical protein PHMEG_00031662 [Phytophthora megakarya]